MNVDKETVYMCLNHLQATSRRLEFQIGFTKAVTPEIALVEARKMLESAQTLVSQFEKAAQEALAR